MVSFDLTYASTFNGVQSADDTSVPLINLFVFLAFSNKSGLGFVVPIESEISGCFSPIQRPGYLTSRVLYDVGADAMCDHGIWVFGAYPHGQAISALCVIRGC